MSAQDEVPIMQQVQYDGLELRPERQGTLVRYLQAQ